MLTPQRGRRRSDNRVYVDVGIDREKSWKVGDSDVRPGEDKICLGARRYPLDLTNYSH